MKKKISKIKRFLTLALIFLFSINSFAASVNNNDGSAFITKAEFDALKSSFQSQIDTYNQNIDSKIDIAISSYLSGIQISPVTTLINQYNSLGANIMFGTVPFNTTVNNKVYSLNCACTLFGDGYAPGESRMSISTWQGIKSNISSDGANNAFNWAELDGGNYFYLKSSTETYVATYYTITGGCYVNTNSRTPSLNLANGTGLRNGVKYWNVDDDWSWNNKMYFSDYMYSHSNTWPAEQDYIRGNIVQIWEPGKSTDTTMYAQAFLLSDDANCNKLIIYSPVESDYCGSKATINPNLRLTIGTYECTDTASTVVKFDGNLAYYPVKTTTVSLTNLYQKIVKDKLGKRLKLYEGLPLFEATNNGEATFDCTLHNTDDGNVNLYFRDLKFENTDSNTGKAGLNGSYFVDNGDADPKNWDKYDFSNGAITLSTGSGGTKIRVNFKAEKGNYYFKLVPSSTTKYAWMSNCSDITFELLTK